jgi:hypothetical protein
MKVDICIPVDDEKLCVPKKGLILLDQQEIPLCDARKWAEFEGKVKMLVELINICLSVCVSMYYHFSPHGFLSLCA